MNKSNNNSEQQPDRMGLFSQRGKQYEQLFDLLSREDAELKLPNSFPTSVSHRLQARKEQYRKEHVIITTSLSFLFIVAIIALSVWGNVATENLNINGVYWYALIFLILTGAFRFIEKKFIAYT